MLAKLVEGSWGVTIGAWKGVFVFDPRGGVYWADSFIPDDERHWGHWFDAGPGTLRWRFSPSDPSDIRTFSILVRDLESAMKPAFSSKELSRTILPRAKASFGCAGIVGIKRSSTSAYDTVPMCRKRMIVAGKISRELFGKTDER